MNQILSVNNDKDKKNKSNNRQPANIKSVIKVFVAILIVFAVCTISIGVYAILNNYDLFKNSKEAVPQISVETTENEDTITLKIIHNKQIKEVLYSWNQENEQKIEGNKRKTIEEIVQIPEGKNTLYVTATDVNDQTATYKKEYKNGGIEISFDSVNENARIIVKSSKTISYITYRWDENIENTIEVNNTTFEKEVETLKGTHTLTVVAVDEDNKSETAKKIVVGTTRPTIDVTIENKEYYLIKVVDENELEKVEIITEDGTETLEPEGKEFEYKVKLKSGNDNKMIIRAYNSNEKAMAEKKVKCTIE